MKTNTSKMELRPETIGAYDIQDCLDSSGVVRSIVQYQESQTVYSQGESAETVLYIQMGEIKLSVVSSFGKEAVVAILTAGDFIGERCLVGQRVRSGTAIAITAASLLVIERQEMLRALHSEHELSDCFVSYMLARNIRIEEDLVDQHCNSSEKRLARTFLLLARYGEQDEPQKMVPKISQETLAEMVGTTRSRVNFFMTKFRKIGLVKRKSGGIYINSSLVSVVLHD